MSRDSIMEDSARGEEDKWTQDAETRSGRSHPVVFGCLNLGWVMSRSTHVLLRHSVSTRPYL